MALDPVLGESVEVESHLVDMSIALQDCHSSNEDVGSDVLSANAHDHLEEAETVVCVLQPPQCE